MPCCLCAKLGGGRRAARRGPAHPRPRAVVAAAEWRGPAPPPPSPAPPALEGGESWRLARLQGRFCVVSALCCETSPSGRRGASLHPPRPRRVACGSPGPRATRRAASRARVVGPSCSGSRPRLSREAGSPAIRGKQKRFLGAPVQPHP